jgi:uncharacterized protein (TIGR03083 family)
MSSKYDLIRKRLRDEGDKLQAMFEALSPAEWQLKLYTDGMIWTIKDVLAHQISAERKFQYYGRDILNGGEGAPEGFVIDDFNNAEVGAMSDRSIPELLNDLKAVRQATIDLLMNEIKPEDFERRGRHPFFGLMSIDEMFKLIYRHNMMHARDIRRALGGADHD